MSNSAARLWNLHFRIGMATVVWMFVSHNERALAQILKYEFTGTVHSDHLFDDIVDQPVTGTFSIHPDLTREHNQHRDDFGFFSQVVPTSMELYVGGVRFVAARLDTVVGNDVVGGNFGLGADVQEGPNDWIEISSCDVIETPIDPRHGEVYSIYLMLQDTDATFLNDNEIPLNYSMDEFEFGAGVMSIAKTGPPIFFSIDTLEPLESAIYGDLNLDGKLAADDIDLLQTEKARWPNPDFDFNNDWIVDSSDVEHMVENIIGTAFGDSNLDGRFDSGDLVSVFEAGQYEDDLPLNSSWATGDWTGDQEFDTADFTLAFQKGAFEQDVIPVQNVPEPSQLAAVLCVLVLIRHRAGFSPSRRLLLSIPAR